jgi:hypothetical protein
MVIGETQYSFPIQRTRESVANALGVFVTAWIGTASE